MSDEARHSGACALSLVGLLLLLPLRKGDVIVREGSPGKGLYILLSGSADASVKAGSEKRIVGTLSSQDVFREMSLMEETHGR